MSKIFVANKLKIRGTTTLSSIALTLILTVSAIMTNMPVVNAHTPALTINTYAYVAATPNPVGLGQYTTIVMWIDKCPPTATGTSGQLWSGYKLTITKPDGTQQIIGPLESGSTGSTWTTFTPDQVGSYSIVFSWPGETATNGTGTPKLSGLPFVGDYFEGSTSEPLTLIVQQQPIQQWQEPPLPTRYWAVPVNAANRGWSTLVSNWLQGSWLVNSFQRWGIAPLSAHVLWSQPITPGLAGGIIDAAWPGIPSDVNDYEGPWAAGAPRQDTPIIMNGRIYYNTPPVSDVAAYGYYCRDLYTGNIVWYKNGTDNGLNNPYSTFSIWGGPYNLGQTYPALTQGWLYHYYSLNGNGILSYLIMTQGTTWYLLDASTGNLRLTLTNVPSFGYAVTDQDGSLLYYSYNTQTGNLLCWNISQSIPPASPTGTDQQLWRAYLGATIDAVNDTSWTSIGPGGTFFTSVGPDDIRPRSGYTMNVTIQTGLPGNIYVLQDDNRVPKMIFGEYVTNAGQGALGAESYAGWTGDFVGAGDTFSAWCATTDEHAVPYSPYPDKTATQNTNLGFGVTLKWYKNYTVPIPGKDYTWVVGGIAGWLNVDYDSQIFTLSCMQTRQMWGYSLATGDLLWGPTQPLPNMDYYNFGSAIYNGVILTSSIRWQVGGSMYAFNATTGKLLWIYNATSIGSESPYGPNYPLTIGAVCNGLVYVYSTEHSPTKPLWRGSYVRCINLTDGTELWKLLDFNMGMGVADGYIVTASQYDNMVYCIGKGPSATTVSASPGVIQLGSSVIITGIVTDQSPGTKNPSQQALYPNGVPAVSDASQEAFMEYLYEQQPVPDHASGVPVTLTAVDSNHNTFNIGTTTSDNTGLFHIAWTPPANGEYTVIASFGGSNSYFASSAETGLAVAAATSSSSTSSSASLDLYIIVATIVIIIAIAIAVIILSRRK